MVLPPIQVNHFCGGEDQEYVTQTGADLSAPVFSNPLPGGAVYGRDKNLHDR